MLGAVLRTAIEISKIGSQLYLHIVKNNKIIGSSPKLRYTPQKNTPEKTNGSLRGEKYTTRTLFYATCSFLNFDLSNWFWAYSRSITRSLMLSSEGSSYIASVMMASQIARNPLAPRLNSTALSTI